MKAFALTLLLFLVLCAPALAINELSQLTEVDGVISASYEQVSGNKNVAELYKITYTSDEFVVTGYVTAPADYLDERYPILIYNRGGEQDHGMLDKARLSLPLNLAMQGYIVLCSQYRGVDGGTGVDEFGGADLGDVLRLIDIAQTFAFARTEKIFMYGISRGGMMTYLALKQDTRITAAAVNSGLSNLFDSYLRKSSGMTDILTQCVGGTLFDVPDAYAARSAILWADRLNAPVLILHGKADQRVNVSQAEDMARSLKYYYKPHKLVIYKDGVHGLTAMNATREVVKWFQMFT